MRAVRILTALSLLFASLPSVAQTAASSLTRIGGAAAVRGVVSAVAPDSTVGRVIESGKPLFLNDHVTTKADGRLQVMLLDETVFTIGPDSDMVLDEFVYDPNTGAGKVTARLTKGVFRFVTGKVARQAPSNMKISVPTATIGIRGTKAVLEVEHDRTTVILEGAGKNNTANEIPGRLEVWTNKGPSQMLTREGFGSDLVDGQPATRPTDHTLALERIMNLLVHVPRTTTLPYGGDIKTGRADAANETGGVIKALGSLAGTVTTGQQSGQNSQFTTQATQSATTIPDGTSTWDAILSSVVTGQGTYTGAGAYTCTGCGEGGTMSLSLAIDFGAKTFGGPTSQLALTSNAGPNQLNGGSDSVSIGFQSDSTIPMSFSGFHGPAVITLQQGQNSNSSSFNGTTITLANSGGIVAKQAQVNLSYSNLSSQTASGSLTATR
jgi:hypothetical protein